MLIMQQACAELCERPRVGATGGEGALLLVPA